MCGKHGHVKDVVFRLDPDGSFCGQAFVIYGEASHAESAIIAFSETSFEADLLKEADFSELKRWMVDEEMEQQFVH